MEGQLAWKSKVTAGAEVLEYNDRTLEYTWENRTMVTQRYRNMESLVHAMNLRRERRDRRSQLAPRSSNTTIEPLSTRERIERWSHLVQKFLSTRGETNQHVLRRGGAFYLAHAHYFAIPLFRVPRFTRPRMGRITLHACSYSHVPFSCALSDPRF